MEPKPFGVDAIWEPEFATAPCGYNIWSRQPELSAWTRVVDRFKQPTKGSVKIGVVGKYVHLQDSYKSLHEALVHGGLANDTAVELSYIDSEQIERGNAASLLTGLDAVLVPGGFGDRGVEGKIAAIRFALDCFESNASWLTRSRTARAGASTCGAARCWA